MGERRRFERKPFNIPCCFQTNRQTEEGFVANLSTGGICIREASGIPNEGAEISVTLHFSPGYDCGLMAQVVHIQPDSNTFGVEFLNPLNRETDDPSLMGLLS